MRILFLLLEVQVINDIESLEPSNGFSTSDGEITYLLSILYSLAILKFVIITFRPVKE